MATLTETAYYARQMIKYGGIGLVVFLLLRAGLILGVGYWRKLHPPPPPPPDVLFGKLPGLSFPQETQPILAYTLETVTGTTPDLGDRARVYFMPIRTANLLALDKMKQQVEVFGFKDNPEQLSSTRYRWTSDVPLPAVLMADVISGSFKLEVDWQADANILTGENLPPESQAISEAQDYLQNASLLPEDLLLGQAKFTVLRADVGTLVKAVSLSEADFVRVDFFRAKVDDLEVYPPNPDRGIVSVLLSGVRTSGKRVVEVNYNYFPVDYEKSGTYPIKTSAEAWAELQAGQGFVARVDENVKQVTVRKIGLGYFDAPVPQNYLYPIYVFEGDDNFVGYVPAIASEWLESN